MPIVPIAASSASHLVSGSPISRPRNSRTATPQPRLVRHTRIVSAKHHSHRQPIPNANAPPRATASRRSR